MTEGRAEVSRHTSLIITYFASSPWLQQSDSKRCGRSSRLWLGESHVTFPADLVWEELRILEMLCWRRLLRIPWTARRSNQSISKDIYLNILWKDWCWSWSSNILAPWCKEPTHWKRPLFWERLKAGGEGEDRGWDSWMASLTQWAWVWASSRNWWWTGKPGVLQSMRL